MADLMKRAVVKFRWISGQKPESYVLGVIDITHVHMIFMPDEDPISEAMLMRGTIYHVAQFKGFADDALYDAVWDWLRGISEIEGKTFLW